ncbi:GUN4 domain-containing protein [Allocoleopsis sp.]|uniref:GUN4 domain-containing protein n=1 Tax=Allocoleopsis sp. TaxID=3088169 RepID=UPI002FCFD5DD
MTTEQPNLQQLAKQGNPKAIAAMLNRSLQPKGITAKASVKNGCLQLMLEAPKVPPKQAYVDSLRKRLTNLMPAAIQKVKVYGKQVDGDFPEWLEEFNLSVQPIQDLSELARQGDVKAINTLINQWVKLHGVTAKVRLRSDCLQVMLESAEFPNQQAMVELLNSQVSKLEIKSVKTMKLFGKQTDEDFPDWHQEISLDSKSKVPSQQFAVSDIAILNTEEAVQSATLAVILKIDVQRLSNQIYETLKSAFYEPILRRKGEEKEKSIHEAARDFIDGLEADFKLVLERLGKPLTTLTESLEIELDSTKISSLFYEIYAPNFSRVALAIKQLDKVTTELLNYEFTEEENTLTSVAKGAWAGFVQGGGLIDSLGSAVGSLQTNDKQQKERKLILEKYQRSRQRVLQEWISNLQAIYEAVCKYISDYYDLKLIDYQSFKRAEELCDKAINYLNNQKFNGAISACERAIELNPILVRAWNLKGCALLNIAHYEEASKDFDKAIAIDEGFTFAWQNKGNSLQKLERDEEAIVAYDKAISLDDDNYSAWLSKSLSLYNLKRYSEAVKASETAIAIESEDYEAWYLKAACAAAMQDSEQVLESLQKALNFNFEACREKVKNNPYFDFDFIRNDNNFKALMEESSVGIKYSELKKLLAGKAWKKADQETAKIMCLAAKLAVLTIPQEEREEIIVDPDQQLTELDESIIGKFPGDDLNTIDKLWIKHSDGKFGFSIQKEIYQSLGGTQEFNGEIRDKFGNQTGWRVCEKKNKYSWRRSDQFEYDFEKAPKGHLPSCLWAGKEDGWFSTNRRDRLIALFARMDACSISNTLHK